MPFVARILRPFQQFVATESAGGVVLFAFTVLALALANSPFAEEYFALWERSFTVGLTKSLSHWINDGLMVVFFLLVGLEIKREAFAGELSSVRQAMLPIVAAAGGMLGPAIIYVAFNVGGPGARGWGIPMATDIAFALGVLTLLGSRVPSGLKVFLTALAIADDIGAVLVIALFYTSALSLPALLAAASVVAVLVICNRAGVRHPAIYAALGVVLWLAVLKSGVHATIAGVLLAATVPARPILGEDKSPLLRMEQGLHGVVAFGIMPLFAFANAGVRLSGDAFSDLAWPIVLGVVVGLVVGKMLGIFGGAWVAVKTGIAALPNQVAWTGIFGVSWLGGIGFTMSLFVATLAFPPGALLYSAKLGILAGSLIAGVVGASVLVFSKPRS